MYSILIWAKLCIFGESGKSLVKWFLFANRFGCVVPPGVWHTVEVLEPSVIFEVKAGKYGEDGSGVF